MFWYGLAIGLGGGGAIVWLFKDWIMKTILGGQSFALSLRDKAKKIEQALK